MENLEKFALGKKWIQMQNTDQIIIEEIKVQEGGFLEVYWFIIIISQVKGSLTFSEEYIE